MPILTLNIGSSSVKYAVFSELELTLKGNIQNIKTKSAYKNAIKKIYNIIKSKKIVITAIAHRIVHGGKLRESKIINGKVQKTIKQYSKFAPIHNIPELLGITECKKLFKVKQVAVFDTAFHSDIPEKAFLYGIPYRYCQKQGIRRYGFHGISYQYVLEKIKKITKKDIKKLKIIICHLGHGCSICAIGKGKSIDTSTGLTPMEGLMMTARSGDIDSGIILYIMQKEKLSPKQMEEILNKKSGLLGLSGITDNVEKLLKSKSKKAKLALEVFTYRITKYIGSYIAALKGINIIAFTGGIGENSPKIREQILNNFKFMELKLDKSKNSQNKEIITKPGSKITAMAVKTDEELMMAREVLRIIK